MPIHDWTLVNAGTYHHFHTAWMTHLSEKLNGMLPEGYYALSEQHAGKVISDILTLHVPELDAIGQLQDSAVAVAEHPPKTAVHLTASNEIVAAPKTLVIRHISGHRVVAMMEFVSLANKDRHATVKEFVEKAVSALHYGCHLVIVDLYPHGTHDPQGMNAAVWEMVDSTEIELPPEKPLSAASYVAGTMPEIFFESLAVGDSLPEMPLYLDVDFYIETPLEETYQTAYRGMPAYWRNVLEGKTGGAED